MGEDVLTGLQMETLTTLDTNTGSGSGLLENTSTVRVSLGSC